MQFSVRLPALVQQCRCIKSGNPRVQHSRCISRRNSVMSNSKKTQPAPVTRSSADKSDVAVRTAIDRQLKTQVDEMNAQMAKQYDAEVDDLNARILDAVN